MKSVSFSALIHHTNDTQGRKWTTPSPVFRTEPELVSWIRAHRNEGDQVTASRREVDGHVVAELPLHAGPEPKADPERLNALLTEMRALIKRRKAELDGKTTYHKEPPRPQTDFDPLTPMLTYDEVYGEEAQ